MSDTNNCHEVIVIGSGVSGIYAIKRLTDLGMDAILLEGDEDLGGTWYRNRYPSCRFDSESYTYGYSLKDVRDEWHWKERFSSQPENLKYLNFVADKYDLRRHMRFNTFIESMVWDEAADQWNLHVRNGSAYRARFIVPCLGTLSVPTLPNIEGRDSFEGPSFHSYGWPKEPVELKDKRVGVVGVGASGIQIIQTIAAEVGELYVFQRRPNWVAPLNNSPIAEQEMAEIRSRYDEIFANCAATGSGFEHLPDLRGFWNLTKEERIALWDELYDRPGFAIIAGNLPEFMIDEAANKELTEYMAGRMRERVNDPETAEKLIPKDHGFGMQRLPLETDYLEAYNRDNVHLVDCSPEGASIECVTPTGIQTTQAHYDLDLIVYATGFDAISGPYDRLNIIGVGGERLGDKWRDTPITYFGVMIHGFPNLFMVAGPQAASGGSNFPRAIEVCVDGVTDILQHAMANGRTRVEAKEDAEQWWFGQVKKCLHRLLMSKHRKGWIVGENSNIEGHDGSHIRYIAYNGGGAQFRKLYRGAIADDFRGFEMA